MASHTDEELGNLLDDRFAAVGFELPQEYRAQFPTEGIAGDILKLAACAAQKRLGDKTLERRPANQRTINTHVREIEKLVKSGAGLREFLSSFGKLVGELRDAKSWAQNIATATDKDKALRDYEEQVVDHPNALNRERLHLETGWYPDVSCAAASMIPGHDNFHASLLLETSNGARLIAMQQPKSPATRGGTDGTLGELAKILTESKERTKQMPVVATLMSGKDFEKKAQVEQEDGKIYIDRRRYPFFPSKVRGGKVEETYNSREKTHVNGHEAAEFEHHWFQQWPDHELPKSAAAFADLATKIVVSMLEGKDVFIHCSAGIGRSGTLGAAAMLLWKSVEAFVNNEPVPFLGDDEEGSRSGFIAEQLMQTRTQRPGAVQAGQAGYLFDKDVVAALDGAMVNILSDHLDLAFALERPAEDSDGESFDAETESRA